MNKYMAIFLDIDNTLYNYNLVHKFAKQKALEFCNDKFNIDVNQLEQYYDIAKKSIELELGQTASSHNRLLYFQRMLEKLEINPLTYALQIYNIYWDSFLGTMQVFDGVYELCRRYSGKICLTTDLTAHIQYRKLEKLQLCKFCNSIVSSEEAGHEKPHPYIFMLALNKLGLRTKDVCVIGDNFKKDIVGALNLNINSIWFNHENNAINVKSNLIKEVNDFKEILEFI